MYRVGLGHEANQEIAAALRRADRAVAAAPEASRVVPLAAVGCVFAGLVVGGPATFVALCVIGGVALSVAIGRDDTDGERGPDSVFDRATGLPLFDGIETVLGDDLVATSVSGRFAVVSLGVPEIAARAAAGDRGAADALTAAVAHRVQSHGWVGSSSGPFGPLIFLRRPGVFAIVLRDVLDDQTTRWLARRLLDIVNEPVRWNGAMIEPNAVIGLAVGPAKQRLDLVRSASEARCRAHREGPGAIVCSDDRSPSAGSTWLVSRVDHRTVGCVLEPAPGGGDLFGEAAAFLRALDDAIETAVASGSRCYVRARAAALSHWDMPARVAARVNAGGAHGRVGIIVTPALASTARGMVWENVEQLRRCGLDVLVDRSDPSQDAAWKSSYRIDGILEPNGAAEQAEIAVVPGISGTAGDSREAGPKTQYRKHMAQYPKELVTTAR